MRLRFLSSVLFPAAGSLTLAAWLLAPSPAQGFGLLGVSLDLTRRDVRVFNNFTDSSANNNTTVTADFPGYDGAELAIWKGCVEWASGLHGSGGGDAHQPGGLGSGGANFDPSWQGRAPATGFSAQRIHSEITGSDGGVLAYCESAGAGWRIRYYQNWTWADGPGTSLGGGQIDLQGVACHEYGHALGLGHSNSGSATMFPSISGNGVNARSISSDDIAGLQAIYGLKSASKPTIASVSATNGLVTITGSNFSATNNEVWFTAKQSGLSGTPVKIPGVTSNGTQIIVLAPASAGPGDVLVRNNGTGFANLSNPFPIDPGDTSANDDPVLTSVEPAVVPALTADGQTVIVRGFNLTGVTNLSFDGIDLPGSFESQWKFLSDSEIELRVPLASQVGAVPVVITTPGGSAQTSVQIEYPSSPVLDLVKSTPDVMFTGAGLRVNVGGQPGDLFLVAASLDPSPSFLPGFVDFALGGNFANLVSVGNLMIPAKGWRSAVWPLVVPPETAFYVQAAVLRAAAPSLPLTMTNLQEGLVVF